MAERDGQRALCARLHLAFQVVGVHIDDAGDQVVAVEVYRASACAAPGLHLGDAVAAMTTVPDRTSSRQDEDGVGQDGLVGHAAS